MPRDVEVTRTAVGGLAAEWLRPVGAPDHRAVLYLHGGGFTMGSCTTHRALAARIALASRTRTLLPELRSAPENPFPAAVEDAMAAYRGLIESEISPPRIALVGDSSGGNLTIALAVLLRDKGVSPPAAIACLSPWVDLELTGESFLTRARVDPLCSLEESRLHAACYIGEHEAGEPLVSPIHADLHGLPPMLTQVGDREVLLSDAVRLTARAREAGVDAELEVWEGMWHVWHLLAAYVPEGRRAIDKIAAFLLEHMD